MVTPMTFSRGDRLEVTIAGQAFPHLLFEFVLSYSGWRHVRIASSETFMALKSGLQAALWELGGCPKVIRSDNLSAATHELRRKRGRDLNWTYRQLLEHYGLESTRSNPRKAHENGVVEQTHRRIKESVAQQLVLRGSKDFASVAAYEEFLGEIVAGRNRRAEPKVLIELEHLRPLPASPLPDYVTYRARVSKWSTIRVSNRTYTIPSRLIGHWVEARLFQDHIDVYYGDRFVERLQRARGKLRARVNYRHVIGSLVKKPGAFERYRWREQLFPTETFRIAWQAQRRWRTRRRADLEYLRILQMAAKTMEADVERSLIDLLSTGRRFSHRDVASLVRPSSPSIPALTALATPDLAVYDRVIARIS